MSDAGPGLDQRACIGVTPDDDAIQRSGHRGVALQGTYSLFVGLGGVRAFARCGKRGFGRVDLGGRRHRFRARVIQLLLGNQPGLRGRRLLEPVEIGLQRRVFCLCSTYLVLRLRDAVACAKLLGLCGAILRVQFRYFEHGKRLPGMYPVTDIDIDTAHITGNLGMDVDNLERLKLSGQSQGVRDASALYPRHGRCLRRGVFRRRRRTFTACNSEERKTEQPGSAWRTQRGHT